MKCSKIKTLLYDYTKNEVTASQKKAIESHIQKCPGCEEELLRTKGIKTLFKAEMKNPPWGLLKSIKKKAGIETIWDRLLSPKPILAFTFTLLIAAFSVIFAYKNTVKDNEIREFYSDSFNIYEETSIETDDFITFTGVSENNNI